MTAIIKHRTSRVVIFQPVYSPKKGILPQIYPPRLGYGLVGNPYGALTGGYGASSLARPVIYGRGPTPAGMAMKPMLLPDGRIGYFL
ncbi:hypothetical protein K2173_018548 [Erythroxylum novogranatense]|uniref:Uncharacterized protein n=1 Tax=Erythroxylum novogranatense TaxID=1862640 RepID=A0AAV8UC40_9ROSI|nr:hypothetical protein K2173_018548 [Erythroxylum novogranatense]